ncbi:MAG TPA: HPP family protein [Desulfobacteria bacterium]|nr:HPP family protein [Desulfobacteria bacterium]
MLRYKIPGWFHKDKDTRPDLRQLAAAAIGSFAGIAITAYFSLSQTMNLMVPSLGASAVLLYAASHVPMAQPKNVLGGHLVSALAGVTVYRLWGLSWWTLALGVTFAIIGMMITDTLHPPGGATAFVAVFTHQDYAFILKPVAAGVLILVIIAIVVHKIYNHSQYPAGDKD